MLFVWGRGEEAPEPGLCMCGVETFRLNSRRIRQISKLKVCSKKKKIVSAQEMQELK